MEGRGNAVATVVVVVVVLALAWYLLSDQGAQGILPPTTTKGACDGNEGAALTATGYAAVASRYGIKTSGGAICNALKGAEPYVKGGAYTASQSLADHVTVKQALLGAAGPATAASQLSRGDFPGAATTAAETLTGANVINTLNYGTPLAQQTCPQLKQFCPQGWKIGLLVDPSNDYCSQMRKKGC